MFDRCLYFNLNALTRRVNKIWADAFAEFDLSPAHGYLLRLVLAEPGLSQTALAHELQLEKSTITRFVDSLVDKGLVVRKKTARSDGREQQIFPTARANKLQQRLEALGDSLYQRMTDSIGKQALTGLVKQLRDSATRLE